LRFDAPHIFITETRDRRGDGHWRMYSRIVFLKPLWNRNKPKGRSRAPGRHRACTRFRAPAKSIRHTWPTENGVASWAPWDVQNTSTFRGLRQRTNSSSFARRKLWSGRSRIYSDHNWMISQCDAFCHNLHSSRSPPLVCIDLFNSGFWAQKTRRKDS
jgi:hypothetical protein